MEDSADQAGATPLPGAAPFPASEKNRNMSLPAAAAAAERTQAAVDDAKRKLALGVGHVSPQGEFVPGALHARLDEAMAAFRERAVDQLARIDQRIEELGVNAESEEKIKQAIAESKATLNEIQAELGELRNKENAIPEAEDKALAELTAARKRVEDKIKALERALRGEAGPTDSVESMARAALLFKRLGLGLKKLHGEIKYSMRYIDPKDPEREFSFVVSVDGDERYHVRNVKPPVPGYDALYAHLQETNDFSLFVRSMRKKFVQLVEQSS